jgi:hypothetical protein
VYWLTAQDLRLLAPGPPKTTHVRFQDHHERHSLHLTANSAARRSSEPKVSKTKTAKKNGHLGKAIPGTKLCRVLLSVTAYPWRRNYQGDLRGADGQPVLFEGANAVVVQYAPMMLKALLSIRDAARSDCGKTHEEIVTLTNDLIAEMEQEYFTSKWCRGSIG